MARTPSVRISLCGLRESPPIGLRWHLEGRVLAYGNKTVVFD
jgi:hypothetical protein